MKVVIIFCVSSFYDNLKKIYQIANISAYSEFDVKGYTKKADKNGGNSNWFASNKEYYDSTATFSFLSEDKALILMNQISEFNNTIDCCSPIHAYMLDVDKFI
ncbi:hypothetical protein [Labilibaculum sp.]|uniref:hypothetical protein n=1 Tax=Labilibaculum sp. TaxID=2060723 RepID=UPI00356A0FA9